MAQDDEEAEALGIPWETMRAEFGFDDVGRRALRGGARDELLADYPHLREEDIEQARRFIEDEERVLRRRDLRPEGLDGLSPNYLFGPYRQDQAKFSCVVKDQWAVAMLLRILAWRA
jgi:hypothetical protein